MTSQLEFDELQRNNELIKMQASCVSHDMRAPLKTIDYTVEAVLNK
jgi:light-regulated signal transduction histidine kinase (bacteriophytochrome)